MLAAASLAIISLLSYLWFSIAEYVPLHLKSSPGEQRAALEAALRGNGFG